MVAGRSHTGISLTNPSSSLNRGKSRAKLNFVQILKGNSQDCHISMIIMSISVGLTL